jgi:hypothetical protein
LQLKKLKTVIEQLKFAAKKLKTVIEQLKFAAKKAQNRNLTVEICSLTNSKL